MVFLLSVVSVPFNAGRGLMRVLFLLLVSFLTVSVPFNAGRGLMRQDSDRIDRHSGVSVPFNAGRGLMRQDSDRIDRHSGVSVPFNAGRGLMRPGNGYKTRNPPSFSTLQCGSWIDAPLPGNCPAAAAVFQYPSMRVVD